MTKPDSRAVIEETPDGWKEGDFFLVLDKWHWEWPEFMAYTRQSYPSVKLILNQPLPLT